jgi:uncharacterized membrane protein YphA (DoxX/SURF4 family)
MNAIVASSVTAKSTKIVLWVLRCLAAAIFLSAGVMKLIGAPMLVAEFDLVGLGQWFRYFTGAVEIAGGVLVLIPSVSWLGAIVLLAVDGGALVAQITAIHMDWVHTVVIGAILGALLYLQRRAILSRS